MIKLLFRSLGIFIGLIFWFSILGLSLYFEQHATRLTMIPVAASVIGWVYATTYISLHILEFL